MTNRYLIGNRVELRITFTDADGSLADPTTAAIQVMTPAGVESSAAPTKESTGVYTHQVTLDEVGDWWYRGTGVGAVVAADEKMLTVAGSHFTSP